MDLHFLYGGAEIGGVLNSLEVIDHAPDDLEPVGDALERLDKLPPRGLDALLELLELALLRSSSPRQNLGIHPSNLRQMRGRDGEPVVKVGMEEGMAYESREQFADAGADVAGLDAVEGREVKVGDEEGVVGGGHGGGEGGAGGGRGPRPGAEGAEWGGGREAGEEEEAGGGGRVWEAGGDGEWEACGGEEGGGKEKHGDGDENSDVLTWARPRPRVGHLAWASQPQPMGRHGKQNILCPKSNIDPC